MSCHIDIDFNKHTKGEKYSPLKSEQLSVTVIYITLQPKIGF